MIELEDAMVARVYSAWPAHHPHEVAERFSVAWWRKRYLSAARRLRSLINANRCGGSVEGDLGLIGIRFFGLGIDIRLLTHSGNHRERRVRSIYSEALPPEVSGFSA